MAAGRLQQYRDLDSEVWSISMKQRVGAACGIVEMQLDEVGDSHGGGRKSRGLMCGSGSSWNGLRKCELYFNRDLLLIGVAGGERVIDVVEWV